jgi:hypothetical protein
MPNKAELKLMLGQADCLQYDKDLNAGYLNPANICQRTGGGRLDVAAIMAHVKANTTLPDIPLRVFYSPADVQTEAI